MHDHDLRKALHERLRIDHARELERTKFIDELSLCGQVRVDVAVLNGNISGFELKSERDTLKRLPKQVEYYSKVLDYATLVVSQSHSEKALEIIPEWWGYTVAHWDGEQVTLELIRQPKQNPAINPHSLVQLLWRDEALTLLEKHNAAQGVRSKPRAALWDRLAQTLPFEQLRNEVRETLKSRNNWRLASA